MSTIVSKPLRAPADTHHHQAAPLAPTPDQVLGPFYPLMGKPTPGGDLAQLPGRKVRAQGQIIHVVGRVRDRYGTPVRRGKLVIWQANCFGRYTHPNDENPEPLDPNFDGFAVVETDEEGHYHLRTVKPGGYRAGPSMMRPPHIHFEVFGKTERFVTQMYFAGEAHNATDRFLQSAVRPEALVINLEPAGPGVEATAKRALFDIVLRSG
jgi:protocatechuate 3,4-dioxygenase, beta subunit